MTTTERASNLLLKPWHATGLLIFEKQARFVEVEVPYLVLDTRDVARAVACDFEGAMGAQWDKRALDPDVTLEELSYYNQKLNDERAFAVYSYTLAAAVLAHRGPAFPAVVRRKFLGQYLHRRILRGGRGVVAPGPAEFLFLADDPTPVIYAARPLSDVTRFSGRDCLSIRVDDEELRLRVKDALTRLEQSSPPTPRSQMNMEDWLTREETESEPIGNQENMTNQGKDDQEEE